MKKAEPNARSDRIRQLNDAHRANVPATTVFVTHGIATLSPQALCAILNAIRTFDAFNEDNDPWGEHDFGSFEHNGNTIYWKIDYYDQTGTYGSPDSTDPTVTRRVLTILLAEEY
jgi:hypothetical protein